MTEKQLRHVEVKTSFCDTDRISLIGTGGNFKREWSTGVRRLKAYGGSFRNESTPVADEYGRIVGFESLSQFLDESDSDAPDCDGD